VTVQPIPLGAPRSEFSVEGTRSTDRRGPLRWVVSHLLHQPGLLVGFFAAAIVASVLSSAVPRLTGLAFDAVLSPDPSARTLLTLALGVLGAVALRGVLSLASSFAIETLGQRLSTTGSGSATSWRAPATTCGSSTG